MVQRKVVEKITTNILCSVTFFFQNYADYEKVWETIVSRTGLRLQYGVCSFHAGYLRLQYALQNMYILIYFPLQRWLPEGASILGYKNVAVLF
jgi:hypothetical protein